METAVAVKELKPNKTLGSSSPRDDVVGLVNGVLERAVARRASDVHFEPGDKGLAVRFRIDGLLGQVETIPGRLAENVVARLKVLAGLLTYRIDVPQEGS